MLTFPSADPSHFWRHALALCPFLAAGAWVVYNEAKKYIGNATISLAATVWRMSLFQSASNAATLTLSQYSEITNEVAEGNGYSSSGKALAAEVWTVGASAGQYKFDADDVVWTGTGGTIPNIKFAVIWLSGASAGARKILCRSTLSSSQFTLGSGNTLTVQMATGGILTLA